MNPKQKIILGVLAALIVITGGLLAYVKFGKKNYGNNSTTKNNGTQSAEKTNNDVNGAPGRVTDTPAYFGTLSIDGKDLWYFKPDNKLYKLILSTGVIQNYPLPADVKPTDVIWPLRGSNIIIQQGAASTKRFLYFDATNKNFVDYPGNIWHVNFMPDGSHIIYNWVDDKGNSSISLADFDTKNFKKIADMPEKDLVVQPSSSGKGVFAYNASNTGNHTLYYISFSDSKVIQIKTSQSNQIVWSPDGQNFVFNKFDPNASGPNLKLWLGNINNSGQDKAINLSAAPTKAVFDQTGKNLYIAVPDGAGEAVWRYVVATGEKKQLYKASDFKNKTTFANMVISPDNRYMFYTNSSDNYIYGLDINK